MNNSTPCNALASAARPARAAIEAFREKLIHANMAIINAIDPDGLSEAIKRQLDRAKMGDIEALKFIIGAHRHIHHARRFGELHPTESERDAACEPRRRG
ncbi:MAG: hypothetical protein KatS3mg105_5042 [Gemmatales bacterium]|nr:MAG: hypothetical protein KatS3mg105_5042 [Gemmatales bacterium]